MNKNIKRICGVPREKGALANIPVFYWYFPLVYR